MRAIRPLSLMFCLAGILVFTGCQSAELRPVDLGPQLDTDGNRRSLALNTPLLHHIDSRQAAQPGLPWYANRNDLSPAATSGYALPTVQSSVTITRDRQYSNNGHVRDQFYSTTYRREYRQAVR